MGARNALDEAFQPEPAEVVGGPTRRVVGIEEALHDGAQGGVVEPGEDVFEGAECPEQRHGARVAETQARCPLTVVDGRQHHGLEGRCVGEAPLVLAQGLQEAGVDLVARAPQLPPVLGIQGLLQVEVGSVVDGRLHPQGPFLLEVGLGAARLVAHGDAGLGPPGDDLGGEASRRPLLAPHADTSSEDERDVVGAPEVQMVADGGLEPGPSGLGLVEHGSVGELQLADRERPAIPDTGVSGDERAGQSGQPAVDEGSEMAGAERSGDPAGGGGIGHSPQAVVELGELDTAPGQLALCPFVSVGHDPHRVGRNNPRYTDEGPV